MKRKLTFLFILFILFSQVAWVRLPQPLRPVRACVYENPPKIYTEIDGAISGFWPDLLRDIATREGWQIEWVRGTWDECLHKLSRGEIDILPDMGWTPERSETFALSSETVLLSWARLYEAKGVRIESVLDLEGKTIAGLEGSFDLDGPHGIRKLANSFGLHCRFVEMSSYTETFEALQSGLVDIAVVDGDFGRKFADEFGVIATPIIIQPTRMLFAFPKDAPLTKQLIEAVDSAVREAKNDPDSVYYQAMDSHLGRRGIEIVENGIPRWTKILLLLLMVILVSLALVVVIFRVQVRRRTRDLRESEERFRLAFHTIPDSIKISRLEDGLYLDINQGFTDMTGYKRDEVIGHTAQEIGIWYHPEDRDRLVEALKKHGRVENMEAKFCTKDGTVLTGLISASVIMLHGEPHILSVTRNIEEIKQAQVALHRSERMLNEAQRIAHIGSWELDWVHDSLYWSDEIFHLLELPIAKASASYEAFMQRVHPEDRERITRAYAESVEKQIPFKLEHRLLMPDGRVKWIQEQCETYYDEEGKPQCAIGTMMDITDRKIMELTLREREETLRTLINATPDIICLKDAQGHWLEANQAYLALFELENVDYRGKHNRELAAMRPFYHDTFQECEKTDELAWQKGDIFQGIESIRRPDGSIRYYDIIKAPIFEENGTRKGLVVIGRDVTALNQALTAEKEARHLAETIQQANFSLAQSLDLKAVLDALLTSLETLVPYDTANVMLRCSETEVTPLYSKGYQNWTDVSIISKIVFDIREKAHLRKIIEEKESVILEDVSRAPDWELTPGTEHIACWLGVPLIAGGEVIGFFSLDKTEPGFFNEEHLRLVEALSAQAAAAIKNAQLYEEIQYYAVELERRVEERTAELVQINQELESFSYSVSHDLRAPLRAIDGFSRILAEDYGKELDEEARRLIGVVRSNAQRMGQLIDDLLSFSRVGRKALLRSEIDMVNLAHSIYYELTDEKQREKIEFILQDLPPALADASLLRQVFTNLLSNAVKFSSTKEAPKIEVGFSVEHGETVYYVRDNGVGFDMNYAHKLFQIFQRLHSQEEFEGTGVGLSIVHRIIVRHGGRVWAESELGQGATFYFSLPSGKPS